MRCWIGLCLLAGAVFPAGGAVPEWVRTEKVRAGYSGPVPLELLSQLKEVGFNAYLLKLGAPEEQWEAVGKYARWCDEQGLRFFLVVNSAGGYEKQTLMADLRKQVDQSGRTLEGTCPLEPRFWERVLRQRAQMALEAAAGRLTGFVLDPEAYTPGVASSPLNNVCYCDHCFAGAMRALGLEWPTADVPPGERYRRLVARGYLDAYQGWLQAQLESILRPLGRQLHERKSDLLLGNFLYQPSWFHQALVRAFSSDGTPAVIWRESTYVGGVVDAASAGAYFAGLGAEVVDVGGTWLGRMTPDNQAAHAYTLATSIDGYWVFDVSTFRRKAGEGDPRSPYFLPRPAEEYFAAFRRANGEIAHKLHEPAYESPLKFDPRSSVVLPPPTTKPFRERIRRWGKFRPLGRVKPEAVVPRDYRPTGEPTRLRGEGTVLLYAEAGETLSFRVHARQVGNYTVATSYALFYPQGEVVAEGTVPVLESQEVQVRAKVSGVYTLIGIADRNAFAVETEHPYLAYAVPDRGLSIVSHARRLFFYVPEEVERFTLYVRPAGGEEQCNLLLFDPTGKGVKRVEQASGAIEVEVPLPQRGRCWSFLLTRPTRGVFEDVTIRLDEALPPVVAPRPEGVLVAP